MHFGNAVSFEDLEASGTQEVLQGSIPSRRRHTDLFLHGLPSLFGGALSAMLSPLGCVFPMSYPLAFKDLLPSFYKETRRMYLFRDDERQTRSLSVAWFRARHPIHSTSLLAIEKGCVRHRMPRDRGGPRVPPALDLAAVSGLVLFRVCFLTHVIAPDRAPHPSSHPSSLCDS